MRIWKEKSCAVKCALYTVCASAALAVGPWAVQQNRYLYALFLTLLAAVGYFYIVFAVAGRNWLDIRAVFHGVWVFTIGLAALQLTEYQEDWQTKTWLCLAGAYAMFQIGASLGMWLNCRYAHGISKRVAGFKLGRLSWKSSPNRLFGICVVTTLIGLGCFVANVMIRGYIPCFSDDPAAYLTFYTRFHVFAVASTVASGFCYYCIKTQKLAVWKKLVLWGCILYLTFLFPIMVVSRGTFVTSALSLTVSVFYLNRKKFTVLVCCVVMIVGVYVGASMLRGYTDAQLEVFFEPATIVGTEPTESQATEPSDTTSTEPSDTTSTEPTDTEATADSSTPGSTPGAVFAFRLSPKAVFIYSYLTVSHDNFNEAVQNSKKMSWGLRQIAPFNVILRSDKIDQARDNMENYLVRDHLNTVNLIGDFYYDFHEWGVFLLMLLWGAVFGVMQAFCENHTGPISLLVLGNAMTPVALNFFSAWTSVFSFWLMWGTALLMAIALYVKISPKTEIKEEH